MKTLLSRFTSGSLSWFVSPSPVSSVSPISSISSISSMKRLSCHPVRSIHTPPSLPYLRGGARGFTLVELMIVIAIIGVLAASLFPMMSNYLDRAKISWQLVNLSRLKWAIESYQAETGAYPITGGGWGNRFGCFGSTPSESTPNGWVPWLVAGGYIDKLPDTGMMGASSTCPTNPADPINYDAQFFIYMSDWQEYKLLIHGKRNAQYIKWNRPELLDPPRDGGSSGTLIETGATLTPYAYGYWTPGAVLW